MTRQTVCCLCRCEAPGTCRIDYLLLNYSFFKKGFNLGKGNINRRQFLKKASSVAVASAVFPYLVPSSALSKAGSIAPSNQVVIGCIGVGGMGVHNMNAFLNESDVQIAAVCDVDASHLENAANIVNKKYDNLDCAVYRDFRGLLGRDDIDAVSIATPDHWHAIPAIAATASGKDIYGEKPLSHNLAEGRAICEAVKRYNRVWQTGSWQRSRSNFRFACELVLNGRIGKVHTVEVGLPSGPGKSVRTRWSEDACAPPEELDYDFWLGPAPYATYCPARVHSNWRWHLDYGGGQLMDWIGHHVDIAHWGLGLDYTGPVEVEGYGKYPRTGLWNSATQYRVTTKYASGVSMIIDSDIHGGTKWVGEDGWVWVNREGRIEASPKTLLKERFTPDEINLHRSSNHHRNFLDCVKSRGTTLTPCEIAHRSATPGHLGQIAMKLNRKIKWDPEKEHIIADPEAQRLLSRPMRSPWRL